MTKAAPPLPPPLLLRLPPLLRPHPLGRVPRLVRAWTGSPTAGTRSSGNFQDVSQEKSQRCE